MTMEKKKVKSVMQADAIARKMPEPKPRLNLTSKKLAAIKDWDVGESYVVTVKITMKEKRQGQMYVPYGEKPDNDTIRAEFEIDDVTAAKEE